jgi:hypothetical protein
MAVWPVRKGTYGRGQATASPPALFVRGEAVPSFVVRLCVLSFVTGQAIVVDGGWMASSRMPGAGYGTPRG